MKLEYEAAINDEFDFGANLKAYFRLISSLIKSDVVLDNL